MRFVALQNTTATTSEAAHLEHLCRRAAVDRPRHNNAAVRVRCRGSCCSHYAVLYAVFPQSPFLFLRRRFALRSPPSFQPRNKGSSERDKETRQKDNGEETRRERTRWSRRELSEPLRRGCGKMTSSPSLNANWATPRSAAGELKPRRETDRQTDRGAETQTETKSQRYGTTEERQSQAGTTLTQTRGSLPRAKNEAAPLKQESRYGSDW